MTRSHFCCRSGESFNHPVSLRRTCLSSRRYAWLASRKRCSGPGGKGSRQRGQDSCTSLTCRRLRMHILQNQWPQLRRIGSCSVSRQIVQSSSLPKLTGAPVASTREVIRWDFCCRAAAEVPLLSLVQYSCDTRSQDATYIQKRSRKGGQVWIPPLIIHDFLSGGPSTKPI